MQNVPCACLICWCSLIHRIFSFNRMLLTTIEKFQQKNASSWTIISSDIIWRFQMPWHHSKSTCAHFWSILVGWNQKRSYPIQFECVASANQSRLLLEIKSQALLFTLHLFLTSSHTTFFVLFITIFLLKPFSFREINCLRFLCIGSMWRSANPPICNADCVMWRGIEFEMQLLINISLWCEMCKTISFVCLPAGLLTFFTSPRSIGANVV